MKIKIKDLNLLKAFFLVDLDESLKILNLDIESMLISIVIKVNFFSVSKNGLKINNIPVCISRSDYSMITIE